MQGLLAKLKQQKSVSSKTVSRSASIVSSIDDQNENDQQSNSDESQQTSTAVKPKVNKKVKDDKKSNSGWNSGGAKEPAKPKIVTRIDTGMTTGKLKLLDATRKAIIEKSKRSFTSNYTQTDTVKTKLCKDQSVEAQSDLSNPIDKSTETEIELVAMMSKDGTLIITSTCGINTDKITTDDVSTQTVMPRSSVAFKKIMSSKHSIQYEDDGEYTNDSDEMPHELMEIENRLRQKRKPSKHRLPQNPNIVIDDATEVPKDEMDKPSVSKVSPNESDSEFEDSIQEDLKVKSKRASEDKSDGTYNAWHDMDFQGSKVELSKSYFADGPTPWSNFKDLVLGDRFLTTHFTTSYQRTASHNFSQASWSDSQLKIVNDLIQESKALVDLFDQVAMLLGPDIKLHNVSDMDNFELPPSRSSQEMTNFCGKLEASLQRLNKIQTAEY